MGNRKCWLWKCSNWVILNKKIDMLKYIQGVLHHKGDLGATRKFNKLVKSYLIAFEVSLGKLDGVYKINKWCG